jgi:COMM domain
LFSLSEDDLSLILDGISLAFEQAAYSAIAPELLMETLMSAGCEESHAKAVGRIWAIEGSGFIGRLKESRTLGAPCLVQSEFRLNLVMAQGGYGEGLVGPQKLNEPTALVELTIDSDDVESAPPQQQRGDSVDKICMEMSHEELFSFFRQLEDIQQEHLDALL